MIYSLPRGYFVRGLQQKDLQGPYPSWFEDQEVCRLNSHGKYVKTKEWFQNYLRAIDEEHQVVLAICHSDGTHVGNISLQGISKINRHAELAVLIGDRKHWGNSLGFHAATALMLHGFAKLNLERIFCGTAANNHGMKKLARRLGMKVEGRRRRHLFLEGKWVDTLEYGILRRELTLSLPSSR